MKNLKSLHLILIVISFIFISLNTPKNKVFQKDNFIQQDTLKWIAPVSANELVNPYHFNDENLAEGTLIYKKHCRSCHGRHGDGHGVEAADLSTIVPDFANPNFTNQKGGSIFWKINEGKNDMKSFKKKLNEEDIWLVIMYIKTFSTNTEEK